MDISKVEENAKETEEKTTKIMKTYIGEAPDTSEALEFLCLAEGGEVSHYEVLQAICGNLIIKRRYQQSNLSYKKNKTPFSMYRDGQIGSFMIIKVNQLTMREYYICAIKYTSTISYIFIS